jgi:hypothetical protein
MKKNKKVKKQTEANDNQLVKESSKGLKKALRKKSQEKQ